jgi:hypothetical protein
MMHARQSAGVGICICVYCVVVNLVLMMHAVNITVTFFEDFYSRILHYDSILPPSKKNAELSLLDESNNFKFDKNL